MSQKTPDPSPDTPDLTPSEREEAYLDYKFRLKDQGIERFIIPNRTVNYSAKLYGSHFETPWHREASGMPAKSERWADSVTGRALIRTFSRGIMGSALMTWGQMQARGYDPYLVEKALSGEAVEGVNFYQKSLGRIAQGYEHLGRGLSALFNLENTQFRSKVQFSPARLKEVGQHWVEEFERMNPEWVQENVSPIAEYEALNAAPVKVFAHNLPDADRALFNERQLSLPELEEMRRSHILRKLKSHALDASNTDRLTSFNLPMDDKFKLKNIQGRSYGHEVVMMTHDFALGSIGDALGRKIAGVLDPNVYTDWWHDGKFDPIGFGKFVVHSAWDVLSYNQMEDWFAGMAYVHQMRFQRDKLAHVVPGGKLVMDTRSMGSFRVDNDGKLSGDYMKLGAADLQARFMGYNFYTLIFRDAYNHIGYMLGDWKKHGYSLNISMPQHPVEQALHGAKETVEYFGKAFIKSMTYMAPAVPFFWMWRVPQTKADPLFINESDGAATQYRTIKPYKDAAGEKMYHPFLATNFENVGDVMRRSDFSENRVYGVPVISNGNRNAAAAAAQEQNIAGQLTPRQEHVYLGGKPLTEPGFKHLDPYAEQNNTSLFSRVLGPLGKVSNQAGGMLGNALSSRMTDGKRKMQIFAQGYVNNALAYTPYMIAKYETANWWDTPFMDSAIYRMEDGILGLKPGEAWAGLKDIGNVIMLKPVSYQTYCKAFHARGLINSMQEAIDRDNKRDLGFQKSFAESVRVNQHLYKQPLMKAAPAKPADEQDKDKQPATTLPPDAIPGTVVSKSGPQNFIDVAKLDNSKGSPSGVTIH